MSYNKAQVKQLQKSINNLKNFRPNCGRLVENSILDPKTRSALVEFTTACIHNKLMEYFKNDPYNACIIMDYIITNNPLGNGTLLKNLYLYHRKDIQRLIWAIGIKYYLLPRHCDTAAQLLSNSLKRFPDNIAFRDDSEIISKLKASDKFRQKLKWDWLDKTAHRRSQAPFSSKIGLALDSGDDLDLDYSFGRIDIYYDAVCDPSKGWIFDCHAKDTYDYGLDDKIPYEDIFKKGLKEMIGENKGRLANNAGWFSQKEQVITKYDVIISFTYYIEE